MTNPPIRIYDNHFNVNEWVVIFGVCLGFVLVFLLPRRFSPKVSILYCLCGVTFGFLFDHVLSVIPVSFYDVNDTSRLEVMDFVSYWMYGPVSYVFFYLYDFLKVRMKFAPVYVLSSALISICLELCTVKIGIFHYNYGYGLGVSFAIYLMVHSVWVWFYYLLQRADAGV